MDDRSPSEPAITTLIALAEQVEHDSRSGRALDLTFAELRRVLHECEHQATPQMREGAKPMVRMRRVVEQLETGATSGRVRSISGLAVEARRLAHELDASDPTST